MFSPLELSVLATLAYSDQFQFPLKKSEILARLLSPTALRSLGWAVADIAHFSEAAVTSVLATLVRKKTIEKAKDYYGFSLLHDNLARRQKHLQLAKQRQAEVRELTNFLQQSPWIMAAAITGSVAVDNAGPDSDIDVLIIAAPRRLWLARIWVLWHTLLKGKHTKKGWCFNLWLEPASLMLEPRRQGVYEGYEATQLTWLFDTADWATAWLEQNHWIGQFLQLQTFAPRYYWSKMTIEQSVMKRHWLEEQFFGDVADALNQCAYWLQTTYRQIRYQETPPEYDRAFMHQNHFRSLVYQRWQQRMQQFH